MINKKRNTMYYKNPLDMELKRTADDSAMDSADPMLTDGYGPEQGVNEGPDLQRDPAGPKRVITKLRKKGMPSAPVKA